MIWSGWSSTSNKHWAPETWMDQMNEFDDEEIEMTFILTRIWFALTNKRYADTNEQKKMNQNRMCTFLLTFVRLCIIVVVCFLLIFPLLFSWFDLVGWRSKVPSTVCVENECYFIVRLRPKKNNKQSTDNGLFSFKALWLFVWNELKLIVFDIMFAPPKQEFGFLDVLRYGVFSEYQFEFNSSVFGNCLIQNPKHT